MKQANASPLATEHEFGITVVSESRRFVQSVSGVINRVTLLNIVDFTRGFSESKRIGTVLFWGGHTGRSCPDPFPENGQKISSFTRNH